MDVTLPSGQVIRGVPEGTTKEAIKQKAISAGLATEADFGAPGVTAAQDPAIDQDMKAQFKDLLLRKSKGEPGLDEELASLQTQLTEQQAKRKPRDAPQQDITAPDYGEEFVSAVTGAPGAVLENIAAFGSGAVAEPAAGLSGIVQTLNPFADAGAGASAVKTVKEFLTYKPRTEQSKQVQEKIAAAVNEVAGVVKKVPAGVAGLYEVGTGGSIEDAVKYMEEVEKSPGKAFGKSTLEKTGVPWLAAVVEALPTGLVEALGIKGVSKTRGSKKITGVSDSTAKKLEEAGIDIDYLSGENIAQIKQKSKEDFQVQTDRLEQFQQEGVTPTRGDITQEFTQQKTESQLFEAADEVGDVMRQERLGQSRQIRENLESMVDELGVSAELGASVKDAMSQRKTMLKKDRSELYKKLGEEADNFNIPVLNDNIIAALPDARTSRDISNLSPGAAKALDDTLRDYGILDGGIDVTPLSMSNFESMRKAINRIERSDPNIGVISGPIKKALDDTIDEVASNLARNANPNIAELAKDARQSNIALKTEFDEKALTSQLIDAKKRGSRVPKVEESNVYQKLASRSTPIEQFDAVIKSLDNQGAAGVKAKADIKNQMLLDIVDSAYGAGSRKISGERTFGSSAYQKKIDTLRPKLETLFTPAEMKRIDNTYKIAESIRPASGAVPKGSAGYLMDVFNKVGLTALMSKVPGGGLFVDQLTELSKKAKNRKALEKALEKPELKATVEVVNNAYPSLAAVLGIAELSKEQETDTETK